MATFPSGETASDVAITVNTPVAANSAHAIVPNSRSRFRVLISGPPFVIAGLRRIAFMALRGDDQHGRIERHANTLPAFPRAHRMSVRKMGKLIESAIAL